MNVELMKTRTMLDWSFILDADRTSCRPPDAAGLSAIVFSLTQLSLCAQLLLLLLLGDAPSQTHLPQDRNNRSKQNTFHHDSSNLSTELAIYPNTMLAVLANSKQNVLLVKSARLGRITQLWNLDQSDTFHSCQHVFMLS